MRTALLCLTALLLAVTICQANMLGRCECIKTSNTVLHISRIKNYVVQKAGGCHIDAVVFLTVRGIKVCSDPKKLWVKKAMTLVDARQKTYSSTASPTTRPTWNSTASLNYTTQKTSPTINRTHEEGTSDTRYRHLIEAVTEQGKLLEEHRQEFGQLSSAIKELISSIMLKLNMSGIQPNPVS